MTSPVPEGTDEAVEAAARAMLANGYGDYYEHANHGNGESLPDMEAARDVVAAAAPYIAAKALRDYADANHAFGGGVGVVWTPAGPIDPDAWCTCGASWAEDGCTEREQLLARADEIERAARAAGKDQTDAP